MDEVTGEFYFQSSNGDLEQLLASDTEAGEITDESKLPPKEEPVQMAEKLMAAPVDLSNVSLSSRHLCRRQRVSPKSCSNDFSGLQLSGDEFRTKLYLQTNTLITLC